VSLPGRGECCRCRGISRDRTRGPQKPPTRCWPATQRPPPPWDRSAAQASGAAAPDSQLAIQGTGIHKWFGHIHVLDDVSFGVSSGEVVVIIGPSGSGKTTLLRCTNHLERIDRGRLLVNGHLIGYRENAKGELTEESEAEIARQRQEIGFVFQQFNLFPQLTAIGNVALAPVRVRRTARAQALADARELLARVGMSDKCDAYPRQLSGGQQQRVAIARALAARPGLLIADEPTSQLDLETGRQIMELLLSVVRSEGITALVATHDEALIDLADNVISLADGCVVTGQPAMAADAGTHVRDG